ncbi:MAG: hypothetical protein ABI442_19360 [Gemmatimonadaceae bacterium]
MRRSRSTGLIIAFVLLAGLAPTADAQEPSRVSTGVPPRERVHPELVDSTWGPQTAAAWEIAHARHWDEARAKFAALHQTHPDGLEAMVGLAFVARATGDREEARRWYRAAAAVEPSDDIRKQLEATEWDRPGSVDVGGEGARVGSRTVADYAVAFVVPVTQQYSLSGRAGVLGAGDPLRGIFIDSTKSGSSSARVLSIGGVARPTNFLTFTARVEYWSSPGENQTFLWFDATSRFAQIFGVRFGVRPLGGRTGAPQVSAATDFSLAQNQVLTLEVVQGTKAALFEPRTQIRAFYYAAPTVRQVIRAGLVRDTGPANQATTGFLSGTQFLNPTFGIRAEFSARRGAFERTTAGGGVVFRW